MSVSRVDAIAYLSQEFSQLAIAVGQDTNVLIGYRPDVDNALRRLGAVESDLATATVDDADRNAFFALAEYYAARRFWRQCSDRANFKVGQSSFDFQHLLKNLKMVLDDAAARAADEGYPVTSSGWESGYMNMDWIEAEIL
jgi:hypothetical protein